MAPPIKTKGTLDIVKKSTLLLPALALIIIFFLIPIALTIYYSFTNLALTGANAKDFQIIGFDNYKKILKDPNVTTAVFNTLIFLTGSLIGQQVIGFTIAYNMRHTKDGFRRVIGPIVLTGWVMPEMVVALCANAFFDESGTLNKVIQLFGGSGKTEWLYKYAMLSVIIANIWRGVAFSMMVFQSALDSVPSEIEEAGRVDGANKAQVLFRITLPYIKQTIATNTMLNTLQTLGVFGLIFSLTGGGPGKNTLTLPIFMYQQAFKSYQLGYGTAISMILLLLGAVLSIIYTRLERGNSNE